MTRKQTGDSSGSGFLFVANRLSLDFVNTEVISRGHRVDRLEGIGSLIGWLAEAGLLETEEERQEAEELLRAAPAGQVLAEMLGFRALLRRLADELHLRSRASRPIIQELNALLRRCRGHLELHRRRGKWAVRFRGDVTGPIELLAPLAEDAARLVADGDPELVRQCGNPDCILYFYDTTKNHKRRWCSMKVCGNRMKVAAFHRRQRAGTGPVAGKGS